MIARTKDRIKSQLYYFGVQILIQFSETKHWSKRFTNWIHEVELPTESAKLTLLGLLGMAEILRKKQYFITKEIRLLPNKHKYKGNYDLLISILGIANLTAMILLTEIGDITRFKDLDKLCSFIGLIPTTNLSE